MELIDPTHFDAIVVTSGLPEVLIGSALARAGKSVLILDPTDSYGASWASLNGPDYVHTLVNRQLEHQSRQQRQQQRVPVHQQSAVQQPSVDGDAAAAPAAADRCIQLQPFLQLQGVSDCALYTHPHVEEALAQKGLSMDLAPKVMYQDEKIVQLLVACQAHNYLEFKLIEGSYIYMSGKLRPVPASRADLFADKMLPLASKRSMGRFLAACMEAEMGYGRLKDAFGAGPLVDLLSVEGLDEQLQQVVLYGIAMADTPQQQQQQQRGTVETQHTAEGAVASAQLTALNTTTTSTAIGSSSSSFSNLDSSGSCKVVPPLISAAEGFAALQLYTRSLGRYGGKGAFMAPCYGCGSLPEAFVRLAAVKGAVTALRHGVKLIQLLQPEQQQQHEGLHQQQTDTAETSTVSSAVSSTVNLQSRNAVKPSSLEAGEAVIAVAEQQGGVAVAAVAAAAAQAQVVLASGQQLTTNLVVCCSDAAASAAFSSTNTSTGNAFADSTAAAAGAKVTHPVACAVALLDGTVVADDTSLLLVFPPGSLHSQQTAVIRGLQLGPAFGVTPPGKYLLYLSAVLQPEEGSSSSSSSSSSGDGGCSPRSSSGAGSSSSSSAEQVLRAALEVLVSTSGLQAFDFVAGEPAGQKADRIDQQQQQQQQAWTDSSSTSCDAEGAAGGSGTASEQQQHQQHGPVGLLPQALAVCYYMTRQPQPYQQMPQQHKVASGKLQQQQEKEVEEESNKLPYCSTSSTGGSRHFSPILWCPGATQSLIGYDSVVKAVEDLYRQRFPDLPWLTDPPSTAAKLQAAAAAVDDTGSGPAEGSGSVEEQQQQQQQSANDSAGVLDDGELDAIDELTAALMELGGLEQRQA